MDEYDEGDYGEYDYDEPRDIDYDLDFMTEHDTAMESIGWGDDDAYGLIGGDSDLWNES